MCLDPSGPDDEMWDGEVDCDLGGSDDGTTGWEDGVLEGLENGTVVAENGCETTAFGKEDDGVAGTVGGPEEGALG